MHRIAATLTALTCALSLLAPVVAPSAGESNAGFDSGTKI